ncbi:potassium/proton antiporter [Nocardioides sp. AE5]|uniref:potassium/proton antiporter n=1 Tax=Nocardioides sp. AE5 TaxID=2962573 RepID=UPI00288151CC|nr:potassium/proton antiporter [Nocardioides sp. AE5]MDT0200494.1 potassium/proton antiporter [Nocardioides sp. AE5]
MSFDVHQLDHFLLLGSVVTLLAILAARISTRAGLPSLMVYLLMGVALGEAGLGIAFEDASMAHAIGFGALALILAEGGLSTKWSEIRPVIGFGGALATVGVLVSVAVMAAAGHYVLGLSWDLAILLGAVCSPTDAAAVFSVLRVVPLPRRITGTLEAESGLNDAPTVVLVALVSSGALDTDPVPLIVVTIVYGLLAGVAIGLAIGWCGALVMRRFALPSPGLYPLAIFCLTIGSYAAGAALHASGFASIYVAALVLGNADLPHRGATRSFAEGIGWIAQIGLFVMLGLLFSPERVTGEIIWIALVAGLLLTGLARPISVLASALVARATTMGWRDLTFISWAGLRGAVPIVLTTIPLAEGVDAAEQVFDIVFIMVIVFTLLTGPTLPWVARVLGVAVPTEPRDLEVEAAPLERISADLLQVTISAGSRMHGCEVGELRLPPGVSVALVIRDGESRVPERRTVLRRGDEILVVTPRAQRAATEDRLQAVSRGGRLAQWLGVEERRS